MTGSLHSLGACEARDLIHRRQLSPVELVDACLARIEQVDPAVNAMVTVAAERARSEAVLAADSLASGSRSSVGAQRGIGGANPEASLLGLPVAIKDLQPTEGIRTTYGSGQFADHVPQADSGIVRKVRQAGGIVIGKTNIPERSIGANTVNRLFGATANPFDLDATCGGSSGGSAVALATEMAPLATGSDHGGSLRIPACYCGVVGFRATPGVVPFEERSVPQTFYSVQGPMARSVEDLGLLLSVIARRDSRGDPMAFPLDSEAFAKLDEVDLANMRIGISPDLGGVLVSEAIRSSFEQRVEKLAGLVGDCVELPVNLTEASEIDWLVRSELFVAQYHREAQDWDEGFNPNIRRTYESAMETPMASIAAARASQMRLFHHMSDQFDHVDAIMVPGVSVSPFPWRQLYPTEVDGQSIQNYMAWLELTAAITVVGHPVVALPAGRDQVGFPFGIQLIGPAYGDHRLLSIAAALENAFGDDPDLARPIADEALLSVNHEVLRTRGREVTDPRNP